MQGAQNMNGYAMARTLLVLLGLMAVAGSGVQVAPVDRALVPASLRDALLNEIGGENAMRHVEFLAANRDRQPSEYLESFFETRYLTDRLREYGLEPQVDFFPSGEVWDAEEGDLWMVAPTRKKLASLTMVPAALARGSASGEIESEVVYVGAGREPDFAGKDVAGKIVLGNASVTALFNAAVNQRGAAGALGTGSAGGSADSAGYSLDQIGWQTVSPRQGGSGFGFVLSLRQFTELRDLIERGTRVVMKAQVRTRMHPYRLNVTSTSIPGSDPAAGELLFVAHVFETIATPGANDNSTGVATLLEIARSLKKLIARGEIPQPRRTLRFLWVPEISGSREFLFKYQQLQDSLLAVMNYDMTGPDLEKTDTYLRMKMTPDSRPSYLNDLIANLLQFVDQTEIRTQQGNNAPFNYRLVPYIANSDHAVFLEAGIPAMQFNHWADNFYHSSDDRAAHADPTEMKRVAFMGAAAFAYLANAGAGEAIDLAWESAANGEKWIVEVARQSVRLLGEDRAAIHERHKAAQNKVTGAFNRARGGVESVLQLSKDPKVTASVTGLVTGIEAIRDVQARKLEAAYRDRCASLGVAPDRIETTAAEREAAGLVPRRLHKVFSPEGRSRAEAFGRMSRERPPLVGLPAAEVQAFIDGRRSVLDIYNAVRAEYGNVTTSSNAFKFAYVVTPDTPDIGLEAVTAYIRTMEQAGLVSLTRGQ
jgi:aminopeptidase YwaD